MPPPPPHLDVESKSLRPEIPVNPPNLPRPRLTATYDTNPSPPASLPGSFNFLVTTRNEWLNSSILTAFFPARQRPLHPSPHVIPFLILPHPTSASHETRDRSRRTPINKNPLSRPRAHLVRERDNKLHRRPSRYTQISRALPMVCT